MNRKGADPASLESTGATAGRAVFAVLCFFALCGETFRVLSPTGTPTSAPASLPLLHLCLNPRGADAG